MSRVRAVAVTAALAVGAALAAVPVATSASAAQPAPNPLERSLRAASKAPLTLAKDSAGRVRFLGTRAGAPVRTPAVGSGPEGAARGFFARYGTLFGVADQARDLRRSRVAASAAGSVVKFQQVQGGLPVIGGELAVSVDASGGVQSVNGETAAAVPASTVAQVTAARARASALRITAKAHKLAASTLTASAPVLWVYDPAILGGRPDPLGVRTVWRTEVTNKAGDVRELVLVDARSGGVALHFNQVAEAKNRTVCDFGNVRNPDPKCTPDNIVRIEGRAATGNVDVDTAYDNVGATYDYYATHFGRDSVDNAGFPLISSVRYCEPLIPGAPPQFQPECPMQNAFWNGEQMVFGQDFTVADDVVAHELTHGVTQFESNLFYYYQSGAINESLSDIFGEWMDQRNVTASDTVANKWKLGEDLSIGAIRDMRNPTLFSQPDRMTSTLYDGDLNFADNGGVHTNSGVGNKAAYLITDGDTFNGQTVTGLGIDKAETLFYAAMQQLTSGSDYADLARVLRATCTSLTAGATAPLTAADCGEVNKALLAVQMDLQPPAASGALAPEAAVCSTGTTRTATYQTHGFEGPDAGVTLGAAVPFDPAFFTGDGWYVSPSATAGTPLDYAHGGQAAAWGVEPDPVGKPDAKVHNSFLALVNGVTVPAGQQTFLRFDHAFDLEFDPTGGPTGGPLGFDGGRLEYNVNGGTTWLDAGSLIDSGQKYNMTVDSSSTSPGGQQLAPYSGFSGFSNGYVSSRLNLSSLAGKSVRLRLRLTSNDVGAGFFGWVVDDMQLYSCGTATPSAPQLPRAAGGFGAVALAWNAPAFGGTAGAVSGYTGSVVGGTINRTFSSTTTTATVQNLPAATNFTATIKAVNRAGAGAPAVVKVAGVRPTLTPTPASIARGATSKLVSTFTRLDTNKPLAGVVIHLYGAPAGQTMVHLGSGTTNASGGITFTVKPNVTFTYAVRYNGGPGLMGAATSKRTVTVS